MGKFPFPPVVYTGAPLPTKPNIITVTFNNDSMASQLSTWGAQATNNAWWDTVRAGYCGTGTSCIMDGPPGLSSALTQTLKATYADFQAGVAGTNTLHTLISGIIKNLPAAQQPTTGDEVYFFYFPTTTTITLNGSKSCVAFGGYHSSMTYNGKTLLYAIVPECAPAATSKLTTLQETTLAASHELAEAVSDPVNTMSTGGYYLDFNQQSVLGWNTVGGGEIGDLCVDFLGLGQDEWTDDNFIVQRIWSTTQASAGRNPCLPIPTGEVYFNAYSTVSAVIVDVGKTTTFTVDALADGSMPNGWTLTTADLTDQTGAGKKYATFSIPGATKDAAGNEQVTVHSGSSVQVSITMTTDPSTISGGTGWGEGILLSTDNAVMASATAGHLWPFIFVTSAFASANGITMSSPIHRVPPQVRQSSRLRNLLPTLGY